MKKLKKYNRRLMFGYDRLKYREVSMLVCSFALFPLFLNAQLSSHLEEKAVKAESYYPANPDSGKLLADEVLEEIRKEGIITPREEDMLNLIAWIHRREGNMELAEKYLQESLTISKQRGNRSQQGNIYNRLGLLYRGIGRFDEALLNYERSLEIRRDIQDDRGLAVTLNNMGNLYRAMGKREEAFESFSRSIEVKKELGDLEYLSGSYLNMGNWMAQEAEYDKAMQYYIQFRKIQEVLQDSAALSMVMTNIGNIFYEQGAYDEALSNYIESLELIEKLKTPNKRSIAAKLLNIGAVFEKQNYPYEAINYYNKALAIYESLNDLEKQGELLQNVGKVYENLNNADSALIYYDLSMDKYQQIRPERLAYLSINIGVIYNQTGNYEIALNYLQNAESYYQSAANERILASVYNNIGATYFYLNEPDTAIAYYQKGLEIAIATDYLEQQRKATFGLAEAYGVKRDFENAFTYQLQYDIYKDSLLNLEKARAIEELITQYETEQKEAEIKVLTAEQVQNEALIEKRNAEKRALVFGLVALAFAVLGVISWFVYSNRKKRIIAAQKEELYKNEVDSLMKKQQLESISSMLEGQEKERKRLAAELHDRLGSVMSLVKLYFSSMNDEIKAREPELYTSFEEGSRFLDDAFLEVRALIKELNEGKTSGQGLEKDLNELLEKVNKIGIEIRARIELDRKLDNIVEMNIYRIIQEALSNSLKYSRADTIELILNANDDLNLTIRDNGVGFDASKKLTKPNGRESYGMENMENRVKLLGGEFSLITSEGKGVTIAVHIPITQKEDTWSAAELN